MTSGNEKPVATPAILIEGARKGYGAAAVGRPEAVVEVSLSVSPGTIHGLLGPNGAGKTTTLKMLLGLVKPSGGRFEILGVDATTPGARSQLGFLAEQPYFPPQLRAGEALRFYGRLSGLSRDRIDGELDALLKRVGLEGRGDVTLSRFSRGMLQRLGLAQALLGAPPVVVLDEPASGLDPVGQRDVRNLMLKMKSQGTTVLLSSHQLSEVEAVCDEVTVLDRGRVAGRGHIDDLLNVAGQTSIRARGTGELPEPVARAASEVAFSGEVTEFSVSDESVRRIVDVLDDAGWRVVSVVPKRESLEDYFARLLSRNEGEAA
ncbi:MAG: ABC transporter ATP-binding protein [Coriobacteriia bacterium]|nr:ABC transporter ATP-binding protein [Coriobacteriia bacterium]